MREEGDGDGEHGGSRGSATLRPRRDLRAGALADRVRGDARPAGHGDQARPARAGLAAAGRARAVHAAGDRALDFAPGADGALPVLARVRDARARWRDVRGRPAASDADPPSPQMLARWRETCDQRLAVELGVAVLAAERAGARRPRLARRHRGDARGALEDFAAYRQADMRLHVGLAGRRAPPSSCAR